MTGAPPQGGPILLFDGLCGFCDGTVRFVLARDRSGSVRFAPLQGTFAASVLERHPELRDVDSLVLVESSANGQEERVWVRSEGAIRLALHLGGVWRLAGLLRVLPRGLRDRLYDGFARNRYRWFTRYESCRVPDAAVRPRFLD
ncbi:MAG: DCC1-like thiol-disulfide oxidoreductase family protein [Gemmatimonadota bacterium]